MYSSEDRPFLDFRIHFALTFLLSYTSIWGPAIDVHIERVSARLVTTKQGSRFFFVFEFVVDPIHFMSNSRGGNF